MTSFVGNHLISVQLGINTENFVHLDAQFSLQLDSIARFSLAAIN